MADAMAPIQLLVVEDDSDQCKVLHDRFKMYGYAVTCAQDGLSAMDMLESGSFDGMLLDLNVPKLHGNDVLLRTRHRYPDMPVLIMSASQSGIRAVKASQAGACGYLVKPFSAGDFKNALHCCFGPAA